jgi:hypothetical protein
MAPLKPRPTMTRGSKIRESNALRASRHTAIITAVTRSSNRNLIAKHTDQIYNDQVAFQNPLIDCNSRSAESHIPIRWLIETWPSLSRQNSPGKELIDHPMGCIGAAVRRWALDGEPDSHNPPAILFAILMGELLRFTWQGSKLRRGDTAFGSRFVGRGYLQNDVFLSGLRPKDKGEGQTRRRQSCRLVVVGRNISLFIGAQYEGGIVDRLHIPGRNKDLGETGKRSHAKLTAGVTGRLRLRRQAYLPRRK